MTDLTVLSPNIKVRVERNLNFSCIRNKSRKTSHFCMSDYMLFGISIFVSEITILALSAHTLGTFDRKLNTFQHSFDLCHSDKVES